MPYLDLHELRALVTQKASAVSNEIQIPAELQQRLKSAWSRCIGFNGNAFKIRSGSDGDQEVDLTQRNVILAAIGSELTEQLIEYKDVYLAIFDRLGINGDRAKRIFTAQTSPTNIDAQWAAIEQEINSLGLDAVSTERIKKFGLQNSWSGCTKGIGRSSDYFHSSVCHALGRNPTNEKIIAVVSKDLLSSDVLRQIRDDLLRVAAGTFQTTTVQRSGTNAIYFGPPGTGKSFRAKSEVAASTPFRTLFHPEYTYADFIGIYRPVIGYEEGENKITGFDGQRMQRPVNYFEFVAGPLMQSLREAFKNPAQHVCLLIEEINRGDCAAIFGDVFQLLDRETSGRSEYGIELKSEIARYLSSGGVQYDTAGDGKLYFPANFSLLATMNTSDQSLYPMDAAFKRRWNWVSCPIDFNELVAAYEGREIILDDGKHKWNWCELVKALNKRISIGHMEDKQIGPWFIKPKLNAEIDYREFLNKCLFYLWHDVFKDEQASDESPFKSDASLNVFHLVQQAMRAGGLEAAFKPELLSQIAKVVTETQEADAGAAAQS